MGSTVTLYSKAPLQTLTHTVFFRARSHTQSCTGHVHVCVCLGHGCLGLGAWLSTFLLSWSEEETHTQSLTRIRHRTAIYVCNYPI